MSIELLSHILGACSGVLLVIQSFNVLWWMHRARENEIYRTQYRQLAKDDGDLLNRVMNGWQESIDLNLKILAMHQEERDRNKKPRRAADG